MSITSQNQTYLSQYYARLDIAQTFQDFKDLGRKNKLDANNYLRQAILKDPFVLSAIIWPKLKWQDFHRHYIEHLIFNQEALLLGPRGHGKSKCTAKLLPIWLILNNRNVRIIAASSTKDQSKKFSREIKPWFERELFIYLFGDFKSSNWLQDSWTVSNRADEIDGPTLSSYGTGSASVTGSHPDYLIIDDGVDIEHYRSPIARENFADFVSLCLDPVRDETTQVSWVGTHYHPEDYYSSLVKAGIPVNEIGRACFLEDPDQVAICDMVNCLWPEEKNPEFFYKKLQKHGEANFRTQFFNDSKLLGGNIWTKDMFLHSSNKFTGHCIMGIDTAYGKKQTNDFNAYCIIRRDSVTNKFIIEKCEKGRWGPEEFRELIQEQRKIYPIKIIKLEKFLKNKPGNQERHMMHELLTAPGYSMPVDLVTQNRDKTTRYHDIVGHWQTRNVIHRPGMVDLENQMVSAPMGQFDDMIDAMEMAFSAFLFESRRRYRVGGKPR